MGHLVCRQLRSPLSLSGLFSKKKKVFACPTAPSPIHPQRSSRSMIPTPVLLRMRNYPVMHTREVLPGSGGAGERGAGEPPERYWSCTFYKQFFVVLGSLLILLSALPRVILFWKQRSYTQFLFFFFFFFRTNYHINRVYYIRIAFTN